MQPNVVIGYVLCLVICLASVYVVSGVQGGMLTRKYEPVRFGYELLCFFGLLIAIYAVLLVVCVVILGAGMLGLVTPEKAWWLTQSLLYPLVLLFEYLGQ